jgi:pseudouridine-5'-phosphate glycosidase
MTPPHPLLALSDEVGKAIRSNQPLVALESTIISHGLPHPENLEMATEVEQIIRDHGAVPATIAILEGVPRVGLPTTDLARLADGRDVGKVSIRDLPYVMAARLNGATTVAATMRLAALAGIRVLVTGGIGGVHRGGHESMDVSADLTELSRSNVGVVCAGVKSVLDVGRTLEVLETLGVPVVTNGSDEFPSFYSRTSGFRTPLRSDSPAEMAATMKMKWDLGLVGAVVIANPIPVDAEIPEQQMGAILAAAVAEARQQGISGPDVTPYLLRRIADLSGGASVTANLALVKSNARLGAAIAAEYARL